MWLLLLKVSFVMSMESQKETIEQRNIRIYGHPDEECMAEEIREKNHGSPVLELTQAQLDFKKRGLETLRKRIEDENLDLQKESKEEYEEEYAEEYAEEITESIQAIEESMKKELSQKIEKLNSDNTNNETENLSLLFEQRKKQYEDFLKKVGLNPSKEMPIFKKFAEYQEIIEENSRTREANYLKSAQEFKRQFEQVDSNNLNNLSDESDKEMLSQKIKEEETIEERKIKEQNDTFIKQNDLLDLYDVYRYEYGGKEPDFIKLLKRVTPHLGIKMTTEDNKIKLSSPQIQGGAGFHKEHGKNGRLDPSKVKSVVNFLEQILPYETIQHALKIYGYEKV